MNNNSGKVYKIVFTGDSDMGKSSIIQSYMQNSLKNDIFVTVGVEIVEKQILVKGVDLKLSIWDTVFLKIYKAGAEKFRNITRCYYMNSGAIIIVYSVAKRETFESVDGWAKEISENAEKDVTITLVGNMIDKQNERQVSKEEGQQKANQLNALFFETSAKNNTYINEVKLLFRMRFLKKQQRRLFLSNKGCHNKTR